MAIPGDTVIVRQGVYRETVTFSVSGTPGAPITLEEFSGETAIIDGCDLVTGWAAAGQQLQVTPGWDLGVGVNQVFVDGAMLPEARWPKQGNLSRPALATVATAVTTALAGGSQIVLTDSNLSLAPGALVGAHVNSFVSGTLAQTGTVSSSAVGTITYSTSMGLVGPLVSGNSYFLFGSPALVTGAGDWEMSAGQLSFLPNFSDSISNHAFELKHRQIGINLSGVSYINIQGINLFACKIATSAASSNIAVQGIKATFPGHNLILNQPYGDGDKGIELYGSNNSITSSVIGFSSGAGITVSGTGSSVANCQIHDTDYAASNSGAIVLSGSNLAVTNNTIYNTGRMGISHYSTTASTITANEIYYFNLQTTDCGGTYSYENDCGNTVISYNLIHDSHGVGPGSNGIFLDNGCLNAVVHHNLVFNVDHGIHLNSPCTNVSLLNNTLDPTGSALFLDTGASFTNVSLMNNISTQPNSIFAGAPVTIATCLIPPTNPLFVNPASANYLLQAGSPAIGAGTVAAETGAAQIGGAENELSGPAVAGTSALSNPDLGAFPYGAAAWTAGAVIGNAPPPAPSGVVASAGLARISLVWLARPQASTYNVYRSTCSTGPFVLNATNVPTNAYADTTAPVGATSYYYVTGVNSFGESGASAASSALCYAAIQLHGLIGEYFNANGPNNMWGGLSFGSPVARQIDPNVNFNYGQMGPGVSGIGLNNFAIRWTGTVTAPVTGTYTFTGSVDAGARLSVNGQTLFDDFDGPTGTYSGTINLVAGQAYPIRMEYCVTGVGGYAQLSWAYPGQSQQIIPTSALTPSTGAGMEGAWYNDPTGSFGTFDSFITSTIDSNFNVWWHSSPQPGVNLLWNSARWRGQLLAPVTANYNFAVMADNGEQLKINGQAVTGRWSNTVGTETASVPLTAGQLYSVELDYANGTGPGGINFQWSFPGQTLQTVPSSYLYTPLQSNIPGIEGRYFSDANFTTPMVTRPDANVNFNWSSAPPAANMPTSNYSVLWSGQIVAPQSVSTYFIVSAVGNVKLTVDGQVLLNSGSATPWTTQTRGIILTQGQRYDIKVEYQPGNATGSIQLLWRCQGQGTAVVIPTSSLFLNYDLSR